jgi:hypothetical protein
MRKIMKEEVKKEEKTKEDKGGKKKKENASLKAFSIRTPSYNIRTHMRKY